MDEDGVIVSLRRDAARYLNMLLGDQIFSMMDCKTTCQLDEMLSAYQHVKEEIERALKHPRPPAAQFQPALAD